MANLNPTKGPAPFTSKPVGSPVQRNINHELMPLSNKYGITEDGDDMIFHIRVTGDVVKRLKNRAQNSPLDKYIYENIVYRALVDYCY